MSNASRCRLIAANYAKLAEQAVDAEARRAFRRLEFLWRDMERLAENFDRWSDPRSKEKIYEMIDAVGEYRRKAGPADVNAGSLRPAAFRGAPLGA
jgi:hypothetical protein